MCHNRGMVYKNLINWMRSQIPPVTQVDLARWLRKTQPTISVMLRGKTSLKVADAKIIIEQSGGALSLDKIYEDDSHD